MTHHDTAREIDEVRVSKAQLMDIITKNRDNHRTLFEEALEAYKLEAVHQLEDHIDRIRTNHIAKVYVSLPLPEDHTEDYDLVLSMLAMGLDDEIVLDRHQYSQYVLDNWGWKAEFSSTYMSYTGKSI